MAKRKVVQVSSSCYVDERGRMRRWAVALCNDNTVWEFTQGAWHELPEIPQPKPTAEDPGIPGSWEVGSPKPEPRPTPPGQPSGGAPDAPAGLSVLATRER
jgi:hypothetical protein